MDQETQFPWASISSETAEAMTHIMVEYDTVRREANLAREQIRRLRDQVDTHPGMGLLNQDALIRRMLEVAERGRSAPVHHTFVCLSLANGAHIRQRYGLAAIDSAIAVISTALLEAVRASDSVASLGGYDFGVLLTLSADKAAALKASQLAVTVREIEHPINKEIVLDLRWGMASFALGHNPRQTIIDADLDLMRRQGTFPHSLTSLQPA
jgi:diguanylate cyclase (GGDEF)-like protein